MKKIIWILSVAAFALTSCGGDNAAQKGNEATGEAGATTETTLTQDSTNVTLPTGDIAYLDIEYIHAMSTLSQTEGVALNEKINKSMETFAQKEKNLQAEDSSIQKAYVELQEKYSKGLITSLDAQKQQESLESRAKKMQQNVQYLQTSYQKETAALQEELSVLNNRLADYIQKAVDEINADGRYKMILNAGMLIDADESLDMTNAVLAKVNALYAADKK